MYIPYDKVGSTLALLAPIKTRKNIREFFNELKIQTNCNYINKNVKRVREKFREFINKTFVSDRLEVRK